MERHTRRAALGGVAASLGVVGSCAGLLGHGPGTPDDGPTDTPETDSPTGTVAPLTLEAVEPPLAGPEEQPRTVTVYPESMALALRRAVRTDGTYRSHGSTFVPAPDPFWTEYRTVRPTGPDAGSEPKGRYEMEAEGGPRYELLVGAGEISDPDAPGASVSALAGARRELALDAIRGERPTVYPETELGAWVRAEWFGNRREYEGTVYRGKRFSKRTPRPSAGRCGRRCECARRGRSHTSSSSCAPPVSRSGRRLTRRSPGGRRGTIPWRWPTRRRRSGSISDRPTCW
jgi:hypothetical protein